MSDSDTSSSEYPPLNDVVQEHLNGCPICQRAVKERPNGLGQENRYCSDYWQIFADYGNREGEVNNIVGHDEYGNYAPRSANPDRPYYPT